MKLYVALLVSCLAGISFGNESMFDSFEMIFKGRGVWKNMKGESGDYSLLVQKKVQEDGSARVTTSIEVGNKTMNWSMNVKKGENGFFTASNDAGDQIGWGYCYKMSSSHVCHMELKPKDGVHVEKTIHGTLDGFHSIGSMSDENGTITWNDYAKRIYPLED